MIDSMQIYEAFRVLDAVSLLGTDEEYEQGAIEVLRAFCHDSASSALEELLNYCKDVANEA